MNKFSLKNKVIVITGAAGLMAKQHISVVLENNGIPVLIDVDKLKLIKQINFFKKEYPNKKIYFFCLDITKEKNVYSCSKKILRKLKKVDILINNAAINYTMSSKINKKFLLENFDTKIWDIDLSVGLKGSLICTKIFGSIMARNKKGVILNIASDLALISPDNRLYNNGKISNVKPVSYSVVKHGIIGLTKYTSTYWANRGVRCNAFAPGGIANNQSKKFLNKIKKLIPLERLAYDGEYKGTILYLISDASSYMNGSVVSVDGGRTVL